MDLFRDAPIGQFIRLVTRNKYLLYPEERDDFTCPSCYEPGSKSFDSTATTPPLSSPAATEKDVENPLSHQNTLMNAPTRPDVNYAASIKAERTLSKTVTQSDLARATSRADLEKAYTEAARQETMAKQPSRPIIPQRTNDGKILVDWYTTDDPENPLNWSRAKKNLVVGQIYIYTLAVYIASAIYTPSIPYIIEELHVSSEVASLGLSMYVLGYGMGPLLWSPMSEIPVIGRNPPYIATFTVYLLLSIGASVVDNFPGLVVLRFLAGFFGSPALATGGASIGDLFGLMELPYYLTGWAMAATSGPASGPIISGFSVPKTNWHWSLWEVVWLAAPVLVSLIFFLPETSGETILLRRASRLRKRTGNTSLVSQSEIDQSKLTVNEIIVGNLWRPVQINALDPAVLFTSVYIGLLYAIFYSFFEAFPLVYGEGLPAPSPTRGYGMNLGVQGLIFLSLTVGVIISVIIYMGYLYFIFNPSVRKNGIGAPEQRLIPGLFASLIAPAGLFIFAWTGYNSPHYNWIVPTIGITVFMIPVFILFQVIFIYIPMTYPQYAASLFAGNDFARSSIAAGAIHFSSPLFRNLGIGRGVSLLGGLTFIGVIGIWGLYFGGAWLRSKSRFAAK